MYPRLISADKVSSNSMFCGAGSLIAAHSRESPSNLPRISSMRRSAVLRPIPGIVLSLPISLELMVLSNSAGGIPDRIVKASLGPTLLTEISFSKILFSSSAAPVFSRPLFTRLSPRLPAAQAPSLPTFRPSRVSVLLEGGQDAVGGERHVMYPHAVGVANGVGHRRGRRH